MVEGYKEQHGTVWHTRGFSPVQCRPPPSRGVAGLARYTRTHHMVTVDGMVPS